MVVVLWHGTPIFANAHETGPGDGSASDVRPPRCQLFSAEHVFDGSELLTDAAVLLKKDEVAQVGKLSELKSLCRRRTDLGDATILPGFIESHAHLTFQNVTSETVLRHGITTVRDTGGPLLPPTGGQGALRLLSAGPIIQAPGGYPLNIFGSHAEHAEHQDYGAIGVEVASPKEAKHVVDDLVAGGATVIKIALEPGGEAGAPWMMDHGQGEPPETPWPMLSLKTVKAIVARAHELGKRVTAHVGEDSGAKLALDGGVDEWAHVPCAPISENLLKQAVDQNVKFVTTIDTLGSCTGLHANVQTLAHLIEQTPGTQAEFIYGSEIGHDNVPWGINGEEMHLMLHLTSGESIDFADVLKVYKSATSNAAKNLGIPLLGTLAPGAPADIIAVKDNIKADGSKETAFERFKLLEYPDLVISGGRIIVNNFDQ